MGASSKTRAFQPMFQCVSYLLSQGKYPSSILKLFRGGGGGLYVCWCRLGLPMFNPPKTIPSRELKAHILVLFVSRLWLQNGVRNATWVEYLLLERLRSPGSQHCLEILLRKRRTGLGLCFRSFSTQFTAVSQRQGFNLLPNVRGLNQNNTFVLNMSRFNVRGPQRSFKIHL